MIFRSLAAWHTRYISVIFSSPRCLAHAESDIYKFHGHFLFLFISHLYRLAEVGYRVGVRVYEMFSLREKGFRRETKLNGLLLSIQTAVWKVALAVT